MKINKSDKVKHYYKHVLGGVVACVWASVLPYLRKQPYDINDWFMTLFRLCTEGKIAPNVGAKLSF